MTDERIRIVIDSEGTSKVKDDFVQLGRAGMNAADSILESWRKAMKNMKGPQTDLAREVRIAMNSTKLAEREKLAAQKAANAAGVADFRNAERLKVAAAREAARQEAAITREKRAQEKAAERDAAKDLRKGSARGMGLVTGAVGLLGVRELASDFITLSDSMQNARNRLQIVTNGSAETEVAMGKLKQMALDTRSSFDGTIHTYTRLAQSTRALGVSQQSNYDMTKVLTQAIAVSGTTTEEATATLIQFSQAMGSNRLSGDEFRSVAEQMPIILDMLAKSTGKAKTELKKMGQEGLLTARVMTIALLESVDDMDAKFKKTMPTIAQSWQNIKTQAEFALDAFNRATGASKALVNAMQYIGTHMNEVGVIITHIGYLAGTYLVFEIGILAKSLVTLAMANPFTALATGAIQLALIVSENRESIRDWLRDMAISAAGGMPNSERANQTVKLGPNGQILSSTLKNGIDLKAAGDIDQQLIHEEYARDERKKEIARLRAMKDTPTTKKHRHKATFDELVQPLEDDVAQLQLSKSGRAQFDAISNIEKQMNSGVARDKWVMLTDAQREYVSNLVAAKKATTDLEATNKQLFDRYMQRQKDYIKSQQEGKKIADDLKHAEADRLRMLRAGDTASFNSEDEINLARSTMGRGLRSGKITRAQAQRANDKLELQDPRTKDVRKQFLEEFTNKGQINQSVLQIWGPNGTLNQGLASAIAQTLVFHKSFKAALYDLGKTIQAEVIQTLVQGLIRMSILYAMGGGKPGIGAALPAIGAPHSAGGYVGGMGRTQIAGYVHGGEYVVNAQATAMNRGMLETINKGGRIGGGGGITVNVTNNGTNADFEARQISPSEVEIIATRVVNQRAPSVVAGTLRDPNSRMSKSLSSTTTARRAR